VSEEKINSQNPQEESNWEAQLQARANEFVNQRIGSLKAEIKRLQLTITEISSTLTEKAQPVATEEETTGLLDYVKQWFSDSSARAEQEFETRLAQAREQWESSAEQEREEEFQKRLEQACTEAAVVARREAESQMEELREQLEASRKALTLAVSSSQSATASTADFQNLKISVEDIDQQRTQSDALSVLVRRAAQFAPRVVFFVVKGGDAVGWKAAGFDNGLNDETVRLLSVPTQGQSLLREALTTFTKATGQISSSGETSVLGLYGSPVPQASIAIPLVVRGKAAAVLYADCGTQPENAINAAALESLMRVASMGIELLPVRRGVEPVRPSGPPQQITQASTGAAAAPATASLADEQSSTQVEQESPAPATEPTPTVEAESSLPGSSLPENTLPENSLKEEVSTETAVAEDATDAKRVTEDLTLPVVETAQEKQEVQVEPEPEEEVQETAPETDSVTTEQDNSAGILGEVPTAEIPTVDKSSLSPQVETEVPKFEPVVPPPPPAPPFYASSGVQNDVNSTSRPEATVSAPSFTAPIVEPPRPAQPMMVPTPASETEQRAHNDARRFARLLVSEIKLYNAAKVNEGRRNLDLYERLRDEIDRSRKVYDKRVSPAVATKFDYFYDELVQTLAEGDVAKLGPNCPGPVMLGS